MDLLLYWAAQDREEGLLCPLIQHLGALAGVSPGQRPPSTSSHLLGKGLESLLLQVWVSPPSGTQSQL